MPRNTEVAIDTPSRILKTATVTLYKDGLTTPIAIVRLTENSDEVLFLQMVPALMREQLEELVEVVADTQDGLNDSEVVV